MPLAPGTRLGPYEVVAQIGVGGMGEVYRATDTNLKRQVAIKVLPETLAADPERLARFQREAEVLAALNHPNIAHIHGLDKSDGTTVLVMELVEGPTLADHIAQGPIPIDEALPIATQIAEALEAAHEQGIIHRDLKPANIKVRDDGTVKVLDFGLAKAMNRPAEAGRYGDLTASPTITTPAMTQAGMILGTTAYMSPEQALGKSVDRRTDIWSFGVLLYELLTGKRMFAGENAGEILAKVIRDEPDLSDAPAEWRPLLKRCLEKDPKKRLRDIGDMELLVGQAEGPPIPRGGGRRQWIWTALTAVLLVALAALSFVHDRETPEPALRATIAMPEGTTVFQGFAVSPDGRYLVMALEVHGTLQLWLRPMDAERPQPVPGTKDALQPFWSPDGRDIAFFADGKLKKVALSGGPAQSLCDVANPHGGSWSDDGVIVFSPDTAGVSLQRVAASGGAPINATRIKGDLEYPVFLPGSHRFLYVARGATPDDSGIFLSSLDGDENRRILPDVSRVVFAPPVQGERVGHILFVHDDTLMAVPFDAASARIAGDAIPVAEDATSPAVSRNGVFVYSTGSALAQDFNQVGWYDRSGRLLAPVSAGAILGPAISHDEKSVAFSRFTNGQSDLWVRDLTRGTETRITENAQAPFWSPQDDRIVFESPRTGDAKLYQRSSNGSGQDELIRQRTLSPWPTQWSRDGRYVVYFEVGSKNKRDIWVLPTEASGKPIPFLTTGADEFMGQLSPDNHWMAFTSDRSGRREVYVRPFPAGDGEWTISLAGGQAPRWRGDGNELYFIGADGKLIAVPVKGTVAGAKPSFESGTAVALFDAHLVVAGRDTAFQYDVTADGQRFLIDVRAPGAASTPSLTVVTNWAGGLRQ